MKKVYSDATSALAGLLHDNMTIAAGGFGLCGIPENLIQALVDERRQGPDDRRQQRRRRRFRHGTAAQDAPGEEGDRLLRRREQGVRAPGAGRRARAAADAAGHARREAARRRRGHPRLLHAHRVRHQARRRQGDDGLRRQGVRPRGGDPRRSVDRQGLEGRPVRQPRLSQDFAQFQSDDRDLRQGHRRRGRTAGRDRRARSRSDSHARDLRRSHHPGRATTKSGSNSARWPAPRLRKRIRRSAS